jgi:hypothetical protein
VEERLRLVRIAKYGPGSEKLSDAQLRVAGAETGSQPGGLGGELAPSGASLGE